MENRTYISNQQPIPLTQTQTAASATSTSGWFQKLKNVTVRWLSFVFNAPPAKTIPEQQVHISPSPPKEESSHVQKTADNVLPHAHPAIPTTPQNLPELLASQKLQNNLLYQSLHPTRKPDPTFTKFCEAFEKQKEALETELQPMRETIASLQEKIARYEGEDPSTLEMFSTSLHEVEQKKEALEAPTKLLDSFKELVTQTQTTNDKLHETQARLQRALQEKELPSDQRAILEKTLTILNKLISDHDALVPEFEKSIGNPEMLHAVFQSKTFSHLVDQTLDFSSQAITLQTGLKSLPENIQKTLRAPINPAMSNENFFSTLFITPLKTATNLTLMTETLLKRAKKAGDNNKTAALTEAYGLIKSETISREKGRLGHVDPLLSNEINYQKALISTRAQIDSALEQQQKTPGTLTSQEETFLQAERDIITQFQEVHDTFISKLESSKGNPAALRDIAASTDWKKMAKLEAQCKFLQEAYPESRSNNTFSSLTLSIESRASQYQKCLEGFGTELTAFSTNNKDLPLKDNLNQLDDALQSLSPHTEKQVSRFGAALLIEKTHVALDNVVHELETTEKNYKKALDAALNRIQSALDDNTVHEHHPFLEKVKSKLTSFRGYSEGILQSLAAQDSSIQKTQSLVMSPAFEAFEKTLGDFQFEFKEMDSEITQLCKDSNTINSLLNPEVTNNADPIQLKDFKSLFIMPIQRGPRYNLLLQEVQKTAKKGSLPQEEYTVLENSLKKCTDLDEQYVKKSKSNAL